MPRVTSEEYGKRLPSWFHRLNWAGGALACSAIGLCPGLASGHSPGWVLWGLFWLAMALGAANNARLGINSIHIPARFRKKRDP
ncbi:MAG: hypothetical protein P8Q97_10980 [Myxococcota bacterium]|nr:hypothetical protein [Myxococcota bacterium]